MTDWPYRFELISVHCDPGIRMYGIEVGGLEGVHWSRCLFHVRYEAGLWFLDLFWIWILPRQ